jgi:hypothetical protein
MYYAMPNLVVDSCGVDVIAPHTAYDQIIVIGPVFYTEEDKYKYVCVYKSICSRARMVLCVHGGPFEMSRYN